MALGIWQTGDPLPLLPPHHATLTSFTIQRVTHTTQISQLNKISQQEVTERLQHQHHFYLATVEDTPVAYGWVAHAEGEISEINLAFTLPERECYLWDFKTNPQWRGRGIYPLFLQAIIRQEQAHFDCFWIMYAPGNTAAEHSIARAGFRYIADLAYTDGRASGIILLEQSEQAAAAVSLLKLPIVTDTTAPR
jgi:GNAT superfamily N-acetyltransferase